MRALLLLMNVFSVCSLPTLLPMLIPHICVRMLCRSSFWLCLDILVYLLRCFGAYIPLFSCRIKRCPNVAYTYIQSQSVLVQ
jgi:hypothetical protein